MRALRAAVSADSSSLGNPEDASMVARSTSPCGLISTSTTTRPSSRMRREAIG
ncbi:Uncharacterised protein [Achromobacter sp. 2789STDY5608633]|nr:Uncharacterised protein [Achromobacter sp. 2789STDY5608633]